MSSIFSLGTIKSVVIGLLTFGVIIFLHELGHFLAAKYAGIKINEFSLGMGPKLFGFGKGETIYSVRILPIGGFVSMEGEDDDSSHPRSFKNKSISKRAIVIVAGVIMNFIFGFILSLIITISEPSMIVSNKIAVFAENAKTNSVLQVGDKIHKMDGRRIRTDLDLSMALQMADDGLVDMVIIRNGEKITLNDVPFNYEFNEEVGKGVLQIDFKVEGIQKNIFTVIRQAFFRCISIVKMVLESLFLLITGQFKLNDLSGPIGVTTSLGTSLSYSIQSYLLMVCMITLNVGVFNILPFPALDGGRLLFLIIEKIRSKPINPKYEAYVNGAGLIALFLLMIVVSVSDIGKLISGKL